MMPGLPPPDPVYGFSYLLPIVIMASALFSLRGTALFAAVLLSLGVLAVFMVPLPESLRRPVLSGTLFFVLSGSLLVLAVTYSRNLLEDDRRESLRRLSAIIEATPDLVGVVNSRGNIIYSNAAGLRMLGVSAPERRAAGLLRQGQRRGLRHAVCPQAVRPLPAPALRR